MKREGFHCHGCLFSEYAGSHKQSELQTRICGCSVQDDLPFSICPQRYQTFGEKKLINGEGERDWDDECDMMNASNGPTKFELVFARFDSTRSLSANDYKSLKETKWLRKHTSVHKNRFNSWVLEFLLLSKTMNIISEWDVRRSLHSQFIDSFFKNYCDYIDSTNGLYNFPQF